MVALVVAYSANRVIGREGGLPWHLPSDMKHFRVLTGGTNVVMGRKTFESLPDAYRPLPYRHNIVLSTHPDYSAPGAEVMPSLEAARRSCDDDCFVIGGGEVFVAALPHADRIFATEVAAEVEGDVTFPELPAGEWRCADRGETLSENGYEFSFARYERRTG